MDFFDTVRTRRSIRIYKPWPVEEEKLQRILEAVNAAPSAGDIQSYEVVVVRDGQRKEALTAAAWDQICIARAPVVLVFCTIPERSAQRFQRKGSELFCIQDAAIAAAYAQLAATALDLSSVWIGSFDENKAREVIEAPGYAIPVTIMPIGYPGETPAPQPWRTLENLVHQEQMGK